MKAFVCLTVAFAVCLLVASPSLAATLTVCGSGCQYTNLQPAIDNAVAGDVIMLRAGQTFVGNFILRAKPTTSTSYITIRSDAPDTSLPPAGVRLVPPGKPGANVASGVLARLIGPGGSAQSLPVIATEPGAHHYRLEFLDIDGTANQGYETLVALGANDSTQTTLSAVPYALVLDRVYVHGHQYKGLKRGIALNSQSTDILNSYFSDVKSTVDAQAIAGFNGPGPFRIINNYFEAAGENVLFGGDDPRIQNLVPTDIQVRGNHMYKPWTWQQPALATVSGVSRTAGSGGSLPAGTYYFKIVAVMDSGGDTLVSTPSAEVSVAVNSNGSVAFAWSAVAGADSYRVYRGTASNGENVFVSTSGAKASFTYTGANEVAGAPAASGTRWTVKNLLEFKNALHVTVDGNVLENVWTAGQDGYALLLTPRNQNGTAPWVVVRDVTVTNNVIRHVGGAINILGTDNEHPSQQTTNVTVRNNIADDVSSAYGQGGFLLVTGGPATLTFDHNTIVHTGNVIMVAGPAVPGFTYTNNFSRHNEYGIIGQDHGPGNDTINTYFPNSVVRGNVLAGGDGSQYPSGNYFPTASSFLPSFTDYSAENLALVSTSPFNNAGTDGTDIGVDMTTLSAADAGAMSGTTSGVSATSTGSTGGTTTSSGGTTTSTGSTGTTGSTLPAGWATEDIGAVVIAGSATASNGTYTVQGAGMDIWGTVDAFQFAYESLSGDGTIVARVASIQGTQAWTKVGVMIRATTDPGSAHAFMLVSAGKGLAFQRRTVNGGTSTSTPGPFVTAPSWVKLTRVGNLITAAASSDGSTWTVVGQDSISMPTNVLVGLAVTNHDTTALATGTFDHVTVSAGQVLPAGWESNDVGAIAVKGLATSSGGTFTVKGNGADIWGTADAFHFASTTLDGDGSIVARVASVSGAQAWTKAGVMMRMTLDAGSAHAFMLVSVGKGLAFQRRTLAGGTSTNTAGPFATAPYWVKLSRQSQTITASVSTDGATWTVVGHDTLSIAGSIEVGLAVTSHDTSTLATATFDNVRVSTTP